MSNIVAEVAESSQVSISPSIKWWLYGNAIHKYGSIYAHIFLYLKT